MKSSKLNSLIKLRIISNLKRNISKIVKLDLLKKYFFIFIIIFLFEVLLISHRIGFYFDNLVNFYKKEQGLERVMIKQSVLHQIHEVIKENNISDFALDQISLTNEINYPFENLFQRVVEISYPSIFNHNSKFIVVGHFKKKDRCKVISEKKNIILYAC